MTWLVTAFRERGVDVPLVTCDQNDDAMLAAGGVPGLPKAMNFADDPAGAWAALRRHRPDDPLICMEYWNGWFDHWGEQHHRRSADDAGAVLEEMLAAGASVNLYMFCGGTNFGFTNGANHFANNADDTGRYQPTITSYDYDAPLSEHGTPTKKLDVYREIIARHVPVEPVPRPPTAKMLPEQVVTLTHAVPLLDVLDTLSAPVRADRPLTMEAVGQDFGFICYSFTAAPGTHTLAIPGVGDRAQVLADGVEQGVLDRESGTTEIKTDGGTVHVLVENLGRINYGPELNDPKGILGDITLDGKNVTDLTIHPLPLDDIAALDLTAPCTADTKGPVLCHGVLDVDEPADTFVALPGCTKGVVWINGVNLGRHWERGPQRTLYLPGPLLRPGRNDLHVLELHRLTDPLVRLTGAPDLGS